jgi:hypothetical protein
VQAHLVCLHEGMIPKSGIMPGQKFVQQHSGDWTMTGTVPVARKARKPLPHRSEG